MTLEEAVKISSNYSEVMRNLGYNSKGGNTYVRFRREIELLNLDVSHFCSPKKGQPLSEIMVENSSYVNTTSLKNRIISEGVLEYKCSLCGNNGEWNGKQLTLQLHHLNGKNNDHRKENLMFLCPNCHSQTETYSGKSRKP